MDVRVTQFGSETEPDSYDLPDQHSSDSSFDRRMLQHMTRQRQTRREIHPRRMADIPLGLFDRKPRGTVDAKTEQTKSSHSQRQRRRLNRPLEDFNRDGHARKAEREAAILSGAAQEASEDTDAANHRLFGRYENIKNGSTPVVRDSDPHIWNMDTDNAIPTVEDSPLSRKSVGRGTPGTAQSTKSRALEKVLSWNMSDDFDENSIIASTPAYFGKRMTLAEVKQAEIDASALRNSMLDHSLASDIPTDHHQTNDLGGKSVPQRSMKIFKAQLQSIEDDQAQLERTRFSRPLSREGDNEQLQNLGDLEFEDTEDEAFMTIPELQVQKADTTSPPKQRPSSSPGRKENIPPSDNHIASAALKSRDQEFPLVTENREFKQAEPLEPIHIHEDPPSMPEKRQTADRLTAAERIERRRRGRMANGEATKISPMPGRSRTSAGDSIDVLRRLSRSVSGTPTPQKPTLIADEDDNIQHKQSPGNSGSQMQTRNEVSSTAAYRHISSEMSATKDSAPKDSKQPIPKTPRVTGAWTETPMLASKHQPVLEPRGEASFSLMTMKVSPMKAGKQPARTNSSLEATAPALPNSALSAVVGTAKGIGQPEHSDDGLGDATINSLEGLMGQMDENDSWAVSDFGKHAAPGMISEEDRTAIIELLEEKISHELPYSNGLPASSQERRLIRDIVEQRMTRGLGKPKPGTEESNETTSSSNRDAGGPRSPMTPRRKDRLLEELQLQRMSEHVNSMHSRTRSLSKGLGRIERKLADTATCSNAKCDGDCFASHPVSAYSRLVRDSLYRSVDSKSRPTTLGWMLLTTMIWALGEMILWFLSSDPIFASVSDTDYGPFKTGPSPPLLLLSAISQPFSGSYGYLADIATAFWILITDIFNKIFGDEVVLDGIGKASTVLLSTTTRAVFESIVTGEADFSMDKDELVGWVKS